jgi:hypothetical protein
MSYYFPLTNLVYLEGLFALAGVREDVREKLDELIKVT